MTTPRANERGHVYRSGECPGRCDSRLSPSVHQGDLREGIPSTSLLMSVELHDGIEVIEKEAFYECCSLCKILSPPLVRAIKERAFSYCEWLTAAILNDGLEEIGEYAFSGCALVCIDIPPSIRVIKYCAFHIVVARGYSHVSRNYYVKTGHVSIVLYYVRPSSVRIKR